MVFRFEPIDPTVVGTAVVFGCTTKIVASATIVPKAIHCRYFFHLTMQQFKLPLASLLVGCPVRKSRLSVVSPRLW